MHSTKKGEGTLCSKQGFSALLALLIVAVMGVVQADETEILFDPESSTANPNVMFLLDTSGSMSTEIGATGLSRMEVMNQALDKVMSVAPNNVNIGLIRYGGHGDNNANGVSFPATDVEEETVTLFSGGLETRDNLPDPTTGNPVRQFLSEIAQSWSPSGYTPIVDALYETALYFRGERSHFGQYLPTNVRAAHPLSYTGEIIWNDCASEVEQSCYAGSCGTGQIAGSCATQWQSVCDGTTTSTLTGQCCGWTSTGTDEAGNSTGSTCSDYSCTSTQSSCSSYSDAEVEVCSERVCQGAKEGEAVYNTPIVDKCQSNYIIVMSDGRPEYSGGVDQSPQALAEIQSLVGGACAGSPQGFASGACGAELSRFLASQDQSGSLNGEQFIETFAVAFGLSDASAIDYLKSLVTAEDGFYTAADIDQLADAFISVLDQIGSQGSSFAAPAYSVSSTNPLGNSDDVYMPLFRNSSSPRWVGNIRKFKLVDGQLVDKNGRTAVDDEGVLTEESQDFWSGEVTGTDVSKGGAASQIPLPENRTLYTDAGGSLGVLDKSNTAIRTDMLRSTYTTRNGLVDVRVLSGGGLSNRNGVACEGWYYDCSGVRHTVTPASCVKMEEVTTCDSPPVADVYREELLSFARGTAKDGTPRQFMGDMINSQPQIINYGSDAQLVFGTNEGYLHALDADTGVEQWAFMPEILLKNIDNFYRNEELGKHLYGIDGDFTIFKRDTNNDGVNDKVYAFFGLRRGGRAYYGFDLSTKNNPVLMWRITPNTPGFESMGEAWSKPTVAKMRFSAAADGVKHVLVFGGGYDDRKDIEKVSSREPDELGRDVYIVDAFTGDLLWSLRNGDQQSGGGAVAGSTQLQHSIPGDIRVLDIDRNGVLDRLYFADTGGNVWRVDMNMDIHDSTPSLFNYSRARLTHFASLGGAAGVDNRKFFYEPDIALMRHRGKPIMTIALGSGYRTHPLNENTQDRFYVLRDPHVYEAAPETFVTLTNRNLADVESLTQSFLDTGDNGWYYNLPEPFEKVMSPAVTFLNKVLFTTFAKDGGGVGLNDNCETNKNSARAYVMDLFTGAAVADLQRDGGNDRSVVAGYNELLDAPQIVFGQPSGAGGGDCKQNDCTQTAEVRVGKAQFPILDTTNSSGSTTEESVNLDMMPQVYWLNTNATAEQYDAP